MCRFVAYMGSPITLDLLVTKPVHSIIKQSFAARLRAEPLNGDGFGVAWYAPEFGEEPATFRSVQPAWSNRNLVNLARVTKSPVVFAHVRAASPGLGVSEYNCHPFTRGSITFMHNGEVGGFPLMKREIQASLSDSSFQSLQGSTDSEHFFALMHDRLGEVKAERPVERIASAMQDTIRKVETMRKAKKIEEAHYLNLAATDGKCLVTARYSSDDAAASSLFYTVGRKYECRDGVCYMIDPPGVAPDVIVASEPLSTDTQWLEIPRNHLLLVRSSREIELRPIEC